MRFAFAATAALLTVGASCADHARVTGGDEEGGPRQPSAPGIAASWNQQPSDYALLTERAFNSKASTSSDGAGAEGWNPREYRYPNFTIASDASAPVSPSSVARIRLPRGFAGEQTPAILGHAFAEQGYRQLYTSAWVKVSPNWQGPSRNISTFLVIRAAYEPRVQVGVRGSGSGTLVPAVRLLWTPDGRTLTPNLAPSASLPRGSWQRWELLTRLNTPGTPDGEVHWWIDGRKVAEYTNVEVVDAGERGSWDAVEINPYWGGAGEAVAADMDLSVDHVYISGSKAAGSIVVPPPDTASQPPLPPSVARVTVTPSTLSLAVGATATLSALAYDASGAAIQGRSVAWETSNPAIATVTAQGVVSASAGGSATVSAVIDGIRGSTAVTVTAAPATLQQVTITPSSATLTPGATQQFSAAARWSDGSTRAVVVAWTATGGSISASGLYAAGSATGTYRVIAREGSTGHADTASVSISAPQAPPPTGSTEPRPGASSSIIFRDDFERYDGSCRSMTTAGGGAWLTNGGHCTTATNGIISSPSGTGYAGSATGVSGRSARWQWPESTTEQFYILDRPISGFSGRGQAEYYSYMYRAPGFVYKGDGARLGKKMFLLMPESGGGRITINPSEWAILQSNGVHLNPDFDRWPTGIANETEFLAYLTNGQWHRYTIMRVPETTTGAMDGALRVWVDGHLVIDRQRLGTYAGNTGSIFVAGTFNGGSSRNQSEYYDDIVVWR